MFLSIHLNLPIESANKNTQNSEMNSACFCSRFSSLKNSRKNGIINSERIISTEDLPCHTTKIHGMRFRRTMKRMILPETSLPSMTKNIRPHNFRFMPRRKSSLHSFIMREKGKAQKEIAEVLGYKTHSAVTKRLQAMREQFEMYIKEQG